MKVTLATVCSLFFSLCALAQTPAPVATPNVSATSTPFAAPVVAATPALTATVAAVPVSTPIPTFTPSPSATVNADDEIDSAIEKKIRKHLNFNFDRHHSDSDGEDDAWIALPIVFIVFLTIFGTPVAIVAVILYFSFSRSRAMHKTVRMMVEKGQPVPEALLNPPPVVRQRSDLRRGVTWTLIGIGMMVFFGACNDWEGGAWSLGVIPFLIGVGHLIFWKFDTRRDDASPRV